MCCSFCETRVFCLQSSKSLVFILCPQLLSYLSSGPPRSSSWSTVRGSVCFLFWLSYIYLVLDFTAFPLKSVLILSAGLEGLVGRWCILAPALLHYSSGHHGAAAALSQQSEVSISMEFGPKYLCVSSRLTRFIKVSAYVVFPFRFSHSPLIDDDDEEEEAKEPMLNEAFGTTFDSSCNLKPQTSVCHIKQCLKKKLNAHLCYTVKFLRKMLVLLNSGAVCWEKR